MNILKNIIYINISIKTLIILINDIIQVVINVQLFKYDFFCVF